MLMSINGRDACGKSTVAEMFVRPAGHLIDFDKLAHEVQVPKAADVVLSNGNPLPDRPLTAATGVHCLLSEKLSVQLIVHPRVFEEWWSRPKDQGADLTPPFSDVPLPFEGGMRTRLS